MDAALTATLLALAVASLVLGMAWASTEVLAVQRALARVLCVVYTFDQSRSNLVDVQIPLLTLPASSLALLGTTAHGLTTQFGAGDGGWFLVASNLLRMLAVWKLLLDHFLALDGPQVLE